MKNNFLRRLAGLSLVAALCGTGALAQPYNRPEGPGRAEAQQRDRNRAWREERKDAQWDNAQYNGYYHGQTWRRGPPSPAAIARGNIAYGYRPWQRGQRLGYYQRRYAVVNYRTEHLRRPPRGYHWVRNDNGDFLMAAIASGIIAQVITNGGH